MASLYLHIPFCEHKCIYCDFYSIAPNESGLRSELPTGRFVENLKREIALRSKEPRFAGSYESVFFGGGTPSLLSVGELQEIVSLLRDSFAFEADAEVTIEVNPGTVTKEKLEAFRAVGFNRLSMGVQSFHADDLRFLTRIHSADQARQCVRDAYAAGFTNVSLDLMFSLPGQTEDRWRSNLVEALSLKPTHISCYSLIVEPNTPLSHMVATKQVALLSLDEDAALYEMTIQYLADQGYEQYEVSNFALKGYRSRHNRNYWNHTNYLGLGPSAHSFWRTATDSQGPERWWNVASIVGYTEALEKNDLPVAGSERLSSSQLMEEELFLGLRSEGIDIAGFRHRYGKDLFDDPAEKVSQLIATGMASLENGWLRLTSKGYLICDEICVSLKV